MTYISLNLFTMSLQFIYEQNINYSFQVKKKPDLIFGLYLRSLCSCVSFNTNISIYINNYCENDEPIPPGTFEVEKTFLTLTFLLTIICNAPVCTTTTRINLFLQVSFTSLAATTGGLWVWQTFKGRRLNLFMVIGPFLYFHKKSACFCDKKSNA